MMLFLNSNVFPFERALELVLVVNTYFKSKKDKDTFA